MIFYLCKRLGNGSNSCDFSLRRGQKCTHCGKIGHHVVSCCENKALYFNRDSFSAVYAMKGRGTDQDARHDAENVGVVI